MDFVLKLIGFALIVLYLAGELEIENLLIVLITGYLVSKHLGLYSGAPVYT